MTTLLTTKFYLPPIPTGFVPRPQLLQELDQVLTHRLTLISAPAGAGKTTLGSAWARSVRKKGVAFGWLSLDEAENTPARFWEYLAACLEEGGTALDLAGIAFEPGGSPAGEETSPAREGLPPAREGLPPAREGLPASILRALLHLDRELVLILDDYHVIQNPEIHAALAHLLDHMPPPLHLVLLTRSDPPLELARMRVSGQLAELRMDNLRFSTQEAAAFLQTAAGVELAAADIAALNTRAEGWIAGLQMAAISLRGRPDAAAFVAAFAGSHRFVFDYLLEQVLRRQTPEVCAFLLKTSVLDRLSAPLCEAVAGTASGAARTLLDTLERDNLFLLPLDDERGWYRYHHLFADLLKLVLEQTYPGLAPELHRRACGWYEAQAMLPAAFHHALAAGDMELAARLVSANVLALVEHAELAPILLRLEAIPAAQRQSLPWLGVAHAWALAYTGQLQRAGAVLLQAEEQSASLPAEACSRLAGHVAAVRAYMAWVQGSHLQAVQLAGEAARRLPPGEAAIQALNLTTLGNALVQYEASPQAVDVLEQAAGLARLAGQSHVFMAAASALAYACLQQGWLHKAHAVCLEAIEVAETYQRRSHQPFPPAASVYAELACVLGEWGEIQPSVQAARRGLALSELWGQADTRLLCLLNLANVLPLAHDGEAARQTLQRARQLAQGISPWFVLNVDQAEIGICLDANDIERAASVAQQAGAALPVWLQARLLVKQNRLDQALSLLECAQPPAPSEAPAPPSLDTVRLGAIHSLALYLKGDKPQALSVLRRTLALAEPENRVAVFLRHGEAMEKLLRLAQASSITPAFTRRLLAAFAALHQPGLVLADEPLVEPLSEREQEVLHYLNTHLSTPEIAGQLFVSTSTVRTHIKNIYGKLGVHGRSGAVRRARELGLLPRD